MSPGSQIKHKQRAVMERGVDKESLQNTKLLT